MKGKKKNRIQENDVKLGKYDTPQNILNSGIEKSISMKIKNYMWSYIVVYVFIISFLFSIIEASSDEKILTFTISVGAEESKVANFVLPSFLLLLSTVGAEEVDVTPDNLVLCREDYTVRYEDGTISLSRDGGVTYIKSIFVDNIVLNHIHVFKNENLFFADHTKCYYSHDWKTLHKSTILNVNGGVFEPYQYHNFTNNFGGDTNRHMIEGQEILVWGNYDYQYDTQYNNVNVWYTVDQGKTVKSAYKFRETQEDDGSGNLYTRHVHNVNFNPADNTFWLQTGDFINKGTDQRHVLKGSYDLKEDKWNWSLIGSGYEFKWTNALFIGDYIYFAWDVSNGGVVKVPYNEPGNKEKHNLILATPNDCLMVIKSHKDELIAVQAPYGGNDDSRNIYYSPDRETWHRIENTIPKNKNMIAFLADMSTDNWGRVRATPQVMVPHEVLPAIFLDQIVRNAGFPDAFQPLSS